MADVSFADWLIPRYLVPYSDSTILIFPSLFSELYDRKLDS